MLPSVCPSVCVELKRFKQDVERKLWQETIHTAFFFLCLLSDFLNLPDKDICFLIIWDYKIVFFKTFVSEFIKQQQLKGKKKRKRCWRAVKRPIGLFLYLLFFSTDRCDDMKVPHSVISSFDTTR